MPKTTANEKRNIGKSQATFSRLTQPAFSYLKLTIETLEQGVKYVQS